MNTDNNIRVTAACLQNAVFAGDYALFQNGIIELTRQLEQYPVFGNRDTELPEIVQALMSAYQLQDYLLFADLLAYHLVPLLAMEEKQ